MIVYRLYDTCPYYGDVSEWGIFSTKEKCQQAIDIRNSNIGSPTFYNNRVTIDEVELDVMPFDQKANYKERGIKC